MARADEAEEVIHDQMAAGMAPLAVTQQRALYLSIGATVIAFAIALVLASVLGANVSRRLLRLSGSMERLAGDDTSLEAPFADHGDEMGAMARSVAVFRDSAIENAKLTAAKAEEQAANEARAKQIQAKCDAFDRQVRTALQSVSERSAETQTAAESMQSTAERTAGMSDTVASAVGEASSNAQSAASGAEELSASIAETLRQISESNDNAAAAVTRIEEITERMKGPDEAAQEIGNVIGLISDIAA